MSVGKLTGPKKAAILLLALGEDAAADVMKNLEESEIQQVGYYMSRFSDVAPEELDLVLEEFYRNSIMTDDGVSISSSPDFVKNTLTKALGADKQKLNVNGGAQALGHPLGGTGAKLMTTLIHELHRSGKRYGLLAICEGGGTANATIIERLDNVMED